MLLAHPVVLTSLDEQYETLHSPSADIGTRAARRRTADVADPLWMSTGPRDLPAALVAARHRLPGARTDDCCLTAPATVHERHDQDH
ncbi:DUF5133 domain-containing protein [Streptomyces sp. YS415]|uniref:DUF5133 domain-containing protein n=1 Tax=Streptomyces sp. YS415 TaxID=2944806 RepID=UPI002020D3FF|nr:DUF5133 domain-containing protein [Streptomyces sp. YS415]MCL7425556.1 DUF5133 domain-containing protein [Streptomyces sp. YS415]